MVVFLRAQINSAFSTLVDFAVTILLVQVAGMWYMAAGITGTLAGGVVNFLLGRYWVFRSVNRPVAHQFFRYCFVWSGNLLLNITALWLMTEKSGLNYIAAKVTASIIIAIGYNFMLQKYFVYAPGNEKFEKV